MATANAWYFILALGFCIACSLVPWIERYSHELTLRYTLFVASSCAIFLYFLMDISQSYPNHLAFLSFFPLLAFSEQTRFLAQPRNSPLTEIYFYQISASIAGLSCLFLPKFLALLLAGSFYVVTTLFLLISAYHQHTLNLPHIRYFLLCVLLMMLGYSLALISVAFQTQTLLIQGLMSACILGSLTSNIASQRQHLPKPLPNSNNTSAHKNTEENTQNEQLATLGHDMRTPLSGILGMTELLLETQLSPTQREYTHTIQESGTVLLQLINERLDEPNNDDASPTLLEEVFDLTELIHYCLDIFKNRATDKGIELISYIDTALPKEVLGDAVHLRQVLSRLIHNALRFTEQGEIIISFRNTIFNQSLGIQFSVQDTGRGLSDLQIQHLFKQVEPHNPTTNTWHIGPSLKRCVQLVSLMGGHLKVDSAPLAGTLFTFSLPLKTPNNLFNESTTEFIASFAGKRLLVVDDNRTVIKVLAEQASQWGMRVSTAENGTEALAVARNAANLGQSFDVIIMDYQMPSMSGLQLGARLKEDTLITNDVILIMLTGLRQNNIQNLARNAGIHRVINKPITNKQLRQVISQELRRLQSIASPTTHDVGHLGKIKVLIAEDNQLSQKVIRGMMQKLGIEHTLVNNGREAVHAAMQGDFDVILMDCDMPIMDGYTATQEIRRWEKQEHRREMPIFALTAHILEEQKQKAFNAGMNKHLSKPIELGELQNVLLELRG